MSALVERLAQALWNAERPFWTENNPFGKSVPWLWVDADEGARDVYRQLAAKVAAELGLTEETVTLNEYAARNGEPAHVQCRWVSAWSEVES